MKFNEWGNRIKDYFPNVEIVGNYDKPKVFGILEIYIRGVGTPAERDAEGRIFLYQNYTTPDMKKKFSKVLETLVFYSFEYGGTTAMARAQHQYIKKQGRSIPKKWEGSHDHPVDIPERLSAEKKKRKEQYVIEDGMAVVCKHWACGARFTYNAMEETICQYHPGRYEFGSAHVCLCNLIMSAYLSC